MSTVSISTELPLPAHTAAALARKTALMRFVLAPIVVLPGLTAPDQLHVGLRVAARIWLFGVIPTWTHRLEIVEADDLMLYTNERSGPVRTWNHRLSFVPLDDNRCRYTDEIETDDGVIGWATRVFIRALFGHRHRRWHAVAAILS